MVFCDIQTKDFFYLKLKKRKRLLKYIMRNSTKKSLGIFIGVVLVVAVIVAGVWFMRSENSIMRYMSGKGATPSLMISGRGVGETLVTETDNGGDRRAA